MANTQWTKDPDHGFIWNSIEHYFYWKENRQRHEVNRKKYLRLCILGAFGAHRISVQKWRLHGFRRIKIKITTDHAAGGLQDDRQQTL